MFLLKAHVVGLKLFVIVLTQMVLTLKEDDEGRLVSNPRVFWEKDLGLELGFGDLAVIAGAHGIAIERLESQQVQDLFGHPPGHSIGYVDMSGRPISSKSSGVAGGPEKLVQMARYIFILASVQGTCVSICPCSQLATKVSINLASLTHPLDHASAID
jgi:hypothetical protein